MENKSKTKLQIVALVASILMLPSVFAAPFTIYLFDDPQMMGTIFPVDDIMFTESGGDIYVYLASMWWKMAPTTYYLHEVGSPDMVELLMDTTCHIVESEQICTEGGSSGGGGSN